MDTSGKILVVESEQTTALALQAALQLQGWEPLLAPDATTALASARKSSLTAVVLSTQLPSGGTMITLKRLRAVPATAATPVILIGPATPEQLQEFLVAGAQTHLAAPVDGDALCNALRHHLETPPMITEAPATIVNDPMRLAALRASGLLDTPPEASFDRVTRLVTALLAVPTALFSLVDTRRQFFKSQVGLPEPWASQRETPLSHSFCQWVVSGREPVTINDAREHQLLRNNLAVRDMGVVAYSGVPISTTQGEVLGSLCAIDGKPRDWKDDDMTTLHDLAKLAESCVAHATLVHQPPQRAEDMDHYVEATGAAIEGAISILRRETTLGQIERGLLYDLIEEYGQHLVQMNRLIQVNQAIPPSRLAH